MKRILIMLVLVSFMSSCAWFREKQAEHHQPFGPHKAKKNKHHKPHH